jgi:hypothetical protein
VRSSLKFSVNGRRVPAGRMGQAMGDALQEAAFQQVKTNVQERLRRVRCPQHHQAPRVAGSGTSLATLRWSIAGCCDRLVEEARHELNK